MSLANFDFSSDEMTAAEAKTTNPYLIDPAKGLALISRLIAHPPLTANSAQRQQLAHLHQLIHERFFSLADRDDYPAEAQTVRELLALEESLQDLAVFPDLANKTIVGVGGGFSAGKSRFLNTLLGEALLPESLEPTTAIPSFLTAGECNIVALNTFNHTVSLDHDALQAITHAFNRHYQQSLGMAVGFAHVLKLLMLHHPSFRWKNLAFLDTPGYSKADLQDAEQTDEKIALQQLTEADYVVWLLNAKNGSIRADDLQFLRTLKHPKPVFFVVTQSDLIGSNRIQSILSSTAKAIDAAGIQKAGLMAWSAPLGKPSGECMAGDNILHWLNQIDIQPKYTNKLSICSAICDRHIKHNQQSLDRNRQQLQLFNALLPAVEQLSTAEQKIFRNILKIEREKQGLLIELAQGFGSIKNELLAALTTFLDTTFIHDQITKKHPETLLRDGLALYHKSPPDYQEAVALFEEAANQDHAEGQYWLGVCHFHGLGIKENNTEAFTLFMKSANHGSSNGQYMVGVCYLEGWGVRQNRTAAVDWLKKSVDQSNQLAQYWLGRCYLYGLGLKVDNNAAFSCFKKSADHGDSNAEYMLGRCYLAGFGVVKDEYKATTWFRKSADRNNVDSQYWLGICHEKGWGVRTSTEEAMKWFLLAAAQGHAEAKRCINRTR